MPPTQGPSRRRAQSHAQLPFSRDNIGIIARVDFTRETNRVSGAKPKWAEVAAGNVLLSLLLSFFPLLPSILTHHLNSSRPVPHVFDLSKADQLAANITITSDRLLRQYSYLPATGSIKPNPQESPTLPEVYIGNTRLSMYSSLTAFDHHQPFKLSTFRKHRDPCRNLASSNG